MVLLLITRGAMVTLVKLEDILVTIKNNCFYFYH